jgi:glycosyltransferase involved in cell wall biosynthesis
VYSASSILIHPATYDNFPSVILEAANFEIPAIASNVCGIPEMIIDGETGYVVGPDDLAGFARRIIALLSNRSQLMTLGTAAKRFVRARFHPRQVARNIFDVIAGSLGGA